MWIIYLIFVILNIVAAPGYLSVLKMETDKSIVILSTISSLLPILLIIQYPHQIITIILIQLIYMVIGVRLTAKG
jgi:hypothetical protein